MKNYLVLLILIILGCSNDGSSNEDEMSSNKSEQEKLEGTWDVVRYFDTTDCENFNEDWSIDISTLDRWEIDKDGFFIQTYDDDGTVKTRTGRWVFVKQEGDVFIFSSDSELNRLNYFKFEGDKLRYLDELCIPEDEGEGFYREGYEWERK